MLKCCILLVSNIEDKKKTINTTITILFVGIKNNSNNCYNYYNQVVQVVRAVFNYRYTR